MLQSVGIGFVATSAFCQGGSRYFTLLWRLLLVICCCALRLQRWRWLCQVRRRWTPIRFAIRACVKQWARGGCSVFSAQAFPDTADANSCAGDRERYHARGVRSAPAQRLCSRCSFGVRGFLLRCMRNVRAQASKAIGLMVRTSLAAQRRRVKGPVS